MAMMLIGCASDYVVKLSVPRITDTGAAQEMKYPFKVAVMMEKDLFAYQANCSSMDGKYTVRGIPDFYLQTLAKWFEGVEVIQEGQEVSKDDFQLIATMTVTAQNPNNPCGGLTFGFTFLNMDKAKVLESKIDTAVFFGSFPFGPPESNRQAGWDGAINKVFNSLSTEIVTSDELEKMKRQVLASSGITEELSSVPSAVNPSFAANAWFNKGCSYHNAGNHQSAIQAFSKAIDLHPKYSDAYNNRGVSHHYLGNFQQAIYDQDKAIELNPQLALAYSNRGGNYKMIGNCQQALRDLDKAIELDPKLLGAYDNRGHAYICLGNYEQALRDYDKAMELNPKHVYGHVNRGDAYMRLGNHEQAFRDFDKALEKGVDAAIIFYCKACSFSLRMNSAEACNWLNKSIEKGFTNWNHIKSDRDLDNIRNTSCYREIMSGK